MVMPSMAVCLPINIGSFPEDREDFASQLEFGFRGGHLGSEVTGIILVVKVEGLCIANLRAVPIAWKK